MWARVQRITGRGARGRTALVALGLASAPPGLLAAAGAGQQGGGSSSWPGWRIENDSHAGQFGYSLGAGDFNGDGFVDLLVGARVYPQPYWRAGRALMFLGSAGGIEREPAWVAEGTEPEERFAEAVAGIGDVNGDGYADAAVGSWLWRNRRGAVWWFMGSKSGLSAKADSRRCEGEVEGLSFGYAVSGAGDVNGDGYADVVVGAPYYGEVDRRPGRIYVFHGGPAGLRSEPDWVFEGSRKASSLGVAVAAAGDVNGDGYADIVVGESAYVQRDRRTANLISTGRVLVFHGSRQGLSRRPDWWVDSPQRTGSAFGKAVAGAGDVNGDGYGDVLVGAPRASGPWREEGKVYLFAGARQGLGEAPVWIARGNVPDGLFGGSLSGGVDVDQDGFTDVLMGANRFTGPGTNFVRVYLYRGSPQGLRPQADWLVEIDQAFAAPGVTVHAAGDVNGDGYAEVCVASWLHKSERGHEGQVLVVPGSATGLPGSMLCPDTRQPAVAWRPGPPRPPWWRSAWVWGPTSLLVTVGMLGAVRWLELRGLRRRLRTLEREQGVTRERTRIAQDMHDHLGAGLTRLALLSELTRRDLASPERARVHVEQLSASARELAGVVDEIVWAVNPEKDRIENLASYLATYADEFLRQADLRCRLDLPDRLPDLCLSAEARHSLFLAAKEALHNVVKHAHAHEVRLRLRVNGSWLTLAIEDDGRGFAPDDLDGQGDGLRNLRRRLEALGGRLRLDGGPGRGTRLDFEVPLHPAG